MQDSYQLNLTESIALTTFLLSLILVPSFFLMKSAEEDIKFLRAERKKNQAKASA